MERENTKTITGMQMSAEEFKALNPDVFGVQTPRQLIRRSFEATFQKLGGVEWLCKFANQSEANARVFVQALSKLVPLEVSLSGKDGSPLRILVQSYSDGPSKILEQGAGNVLRDVTDVALQDSQSYEQIDEDAAISTDVQGEVDAH